jgi:putative transcriptional regulator
MRATTQKNSSRLTKALLETANDMKAGGVLTDVQHRKITLRHLGEAPVVEALTPTQIKQVREHAQMSQGAFARHLRTTAGYVSKLERGETEPTGPTLVLLNVIRRKGIEVLR